MRRILMMAGLAVLIATPSLAQARTYCDQNGHDRRVAGTVLGAVGGALIGNAVSHRNGALIGGLGGAVVGNQLARTKCYNRPQAAYRSSGRVYARPYNSEYVQAGNCHIESRAYYDDRGQLVQQPTRVCE
ncbi:glycine zipper 2TM domain-containing protein [Phenylobacterium aquaticum]|uniref:YMGG-like glycine zipper-containing protein n=1 Tax=Phenylobacterium aquaticum TaxID=1763816 RepID=UPI0026EA1861|nr:glycine zipper 2TM domain-containing protein [Phenylobacterium aquaticum]